MEDNYRHQGMRKRMVEVLSQRISDPRVLEALGKFPRHHFFDGALIEHAYQDKAFPIGSGQTISRPYTVAQQSELLNIKRGDKVLEIGTGCGYQTAILMILGARVFTIERQRELFLKTKKLLPRLGYRPRFFYGDGYIGKEEFAPFDKIIVTAGAPFIPDPLKDQLKVGGIMVIPVGETSAQRMLRLHKVAEGEFEVEDLGDCSFVPMLEDKV